MRTDPRSRRYRWLVRAWSVFLVLLVAALAVNAISPAARLWLVEDLGQTGQLTIFNSIDRGGFYGLPVELGDFDGDGRVDFAIAPMSAPAGPALERAEAGQVYIYPGNGQISGVIDRNQLPLAESGLTLWGANAGDFLGDELYAADVNGDGIEDILVGAQNYDLPLPGGGRRDNCGAVFAILGRPGLLDGGNVIDLRSPTADVITFAGSQAGERFGIWVEAGDLDGDGREDIIVGADQYPAAVGGPDPRTHRGKVYVIYGRGAYSPMVDLSLLSEGLSEVLGRDAEDHFGAAVHAVDLDSDGAAELIASAGLNRLSASFAGPSAFDGHGSGAGDGPDNTRRDAGETYVFFGTRGGRLPPRIDLAEPLDDEVSSRLTTIYGAAPDAEAGEELTSGDFNGDGFTDLVIGALSAPNPRGDRLAGTAHVLYWRPGLAGLTIDLSPNRTIPLPDALVVSELFGLKARDILGDTLSAGDFDHDGFDDLAVGIPHFDRDPLDPFDESGAVALVFGRAQPFPSSWSPQADEVPASLRIAFVLGSQRGDLLSYSMEARDVDADGFADLFPNAMRGDGFDGRRTDAGEAVVVSGFHLSGASLSLESVTPATGQVGEASLVTIHGGGFTTDSDTELELGGAVVTPFQVLSSSRIQAVLPPSPVPGTRDLRVLNRYGSVILAGAFLDTDVLTFVRGDANGDGLVDLSDAVVILGFLFLGGQVECRDAADADDDGEVVITDPIYVLGYRFLGGPPPPPPFPAAGTDSTADPLGCRE